MKTRQPSKRKFQGKTFSGKSSETKSPSAERAFGSLVWYLARRDHSEKELRTKLGRRYTAEAVDQAITKAQESNWMKAPEELTELFSRGLHRQNRGFFAVNRKLKQKGLPPIVKDSRLELEKAREAFNRKYKPDLDPAPLDRKTANQAYRFLANRGFDHDTIMLVLKNADLD